MSLPTQDENWTQNLRDYGEHRKEMFNANNEPCGIWKWYYDEEKTRKKAEMVFDDDYPIYMTCWYKNGAMKEQGRYKDGFPRGEGWKIWSENGELVFGEKEESWLNPIDAGYVAGSLGLVAFGWVSGFAFAMTYTITTILNWLTK